MKRLVIDRSRWLRGDEDSSYLLRSSDNKMCCLGFFALKCGYELEDIKDRSNPSEVYLNSKFPKSIVRGGGDTKTCKKLMIINDSTELTEPDRESQLKALFKRIGYMVRFVD